MKSNGKIAISTQVEIDAFVELLARSKAVWMVPELLNLAAMASSPSVAYDLVLTATGKRKKALAARWFAIAIRDYFPQVPQACVRWLRVNDLHLGRLKEYLKTTLLLEE
jgi:hypothetical protein